MKIRPIVRNSKQEIEENLEAYENDSGKDKEHILYFVQKDVIQNSIDAKVDDKDFSVTFELMEYKNDKYLIITDTGTTGLLGNGIPRDRENDEEAVFEYLEKNENEKWGRFESFYFKKGKAYNKDLGSKGRGKLIFLAASVDNRIYFDSLRTDGTYKFGGIYYKGGFNGIVEEEGDESKKTLKQELPFLNPLTKIGTRIIIVNPYYYVVEDFKNLESYIQETWWLALQKGIKFYYKGFDGVMKEVRPNPRLDFDKINKSQKIEKELGTLKKGTEFRYKKLVIALADSPLDEPLAGIYIQRGLMKVCSFTDYDLDLPEENKNRIYSYIIFDENTEKEFRDKIEAITHFAYKKVGLGRVIDKFLKDNIRKFAISMGLLNAEKSGPNDHAAIVVQNRTNEINRVLAKLGIKGGFGPGPSSSTSSPQQSSNIFFMTTGLNENNAYEPGDKLSFNAKIINKKLNPIGPYHVDMNLYKEAIVGQNFVESLFSGTYAKLDVDRDYLISNVKSYKFPKRYKGKYIIEKTIADKEGREVYRRNDVLWVGVPPELRNGIFQIHSRVEEKNNFLYEPHYIPEENKYIIDINEGHPYYKKIKEDKNDELIALLTDLIIANSVSFVLATEPDRFADTQFAKTNGLFPEGPTEKIFEIERKNLALLLSRMHG